MTPVASHPPREVAVSDVSNVGRRRDERIRLTAVRVVRRGPTEGPENIASLAALASDVCLTRMFYPQWGTLVPARESWRGGVNICKRRCSHRVAERSQFSKDS